MCVLYLPRTIGVRLNLASLIKLAGTAYTRVELEALADVCRKNNITILSDEIYARLSFGDGHVCMADVYPEGTILTSGFSKWSR